MPEKKHPLVISVDVLVNPQDAAAYRDLVQGHADRTRQEPGCLSFDVAEADDAPGTFRIWETYRDAAAIADHESRPYLATFRAAVTPLIKSRVLKRFTIFTS
jgi:quinol monooxygenase YgiN